MIPIDSEVMMVDTNQLKYILHDTWASPPLLLEIFPSVSRAIINQHLFTFGIIRPGQGLLLSS